MKRYVLVACYLFALIASSCVTNRLASIDEGIFKRIASVEHRCLNDAECEKQAKAYADKRLIPLPPPVSINPLIFSFWEGKGKNKQEVLFKVSAYTPAEITYFEIDKIPNSDYNTNAKTLKEVANLLISAPNSGVTEVLPSTPDNFITNGKRPCRVLLKTTKPINFTKRGFLPVIGDFGLIINPPYPP